MFNLCCYEFVCIPIGLIETWISDSEIKQPVWQQREMTSWSKWDLTGHMISTWRPPESDLLHVKENKATDLTLITKYTFNVNNKW